MAKPLHILHIEDSEEDCGLIWRLLRKEWPEAEFLCVETGAHLRTLLAAHEFNVILSDYRLPEFDGMEALDISRELKPEVPFIFVSGMMGEEIAIESLRHGATDYVLKDRLTRLVPAIRRALGEAEERRVNQELQRRLLEAERLQTVTTLSEGISHDFNNIFTIILGHAALLRADAGNPERVQKIAETITQAARRATAIVQQLMAFAQKSEGRATVIDLDRAVDQILKRFIGGLPATIRFTFQPQGRMPSIALDASQLETILLNLLANAQDSMPEGGELRVSTRLLSAQECRQPHGHAYERYICLAVADTGRGMDAATRGHIFEPFYTTKERGRGTGLGLPAVYGLMQSLGGWIEVESEPARGTTMSLFFPVVQAVPSRPDTSATTRLPGKVDSVALLVIEDEEDVLYFLVSILTRKGYVVHAAHNHDEALALFSSHAGEIRLVFSDIGLPGIDGLAVCEKLKARKPDLKIIVSSGYSPKDFKERIEALGVDAFLPKPYGPEKLTQCIRETLAVSLARTN
jgi:signal transduction histidine kinase